MSVTIEAARFVNEWAIWGTLSMLGQVDDRKRPTQERGPGMDRVVRRNGRPTIHRTCVCQKSYGGESDLCRAAVGDWGRDLGCDVREEAASDRANNWLRSLRPFPPVYCWSRRSRKGPMAGNNIGETFDTVPQAAYSTECVGLPSTSFHEELCRPGADFHRNWLGALKK